jgi:hypothetical protein
VLQKIGEEIAPSPIYYFLGLAGGLFPLPPPEGFPVVLGPFAGLPLFAMVIKFKNECLL